MRYALFLGCTIQSSLKQYEVSSKLIFDKLGIEVVDIPDFNCCGYPFRNYDHRAYILSAARNLAIAAEKGLNIITLCKCCFGNLKNAETLLREDGALLTEMNGILSEEKLKVDNSTEVNHYLSVLYNRVGVKNIEEKVVRPFKNLNLAVHYGCHALRPSRVTQFDDPNDPKIFDELVEATGARSVPWQNRLECCGAPMLGINDPLSLDIMGKKTESARLSGADYLCSACSYCQAQFDKAQSKSLAGRSGAGGMASILYSQLLGLAMGIEPDALQIDLNEIDISGITQFV